jgi:hypothetical protein
VGLGLVKRNPNSLCETKTTPGPCSLVAGLDLPTTREWYWLLANAATENTKGPRKIVGRNGGRSRVRTADPLGVNEVL